MLRNVLVFCVHSVQCTVYSVQCTVYSAQCTGHNVQSKVYSVQSVKKHRDLTLAIPDFLMYSSCHRPKLKPRTSHLPPSLTNLPSHFH